MKLSIVTINRNNAAGLRATLESTLGGQRSFGDWEQIVVDGASTDGSFAELDRWRGDPRLGWCVSEPDAGIFNAMNKGAAHAHGDYLLFLNSGDTLEPEVLGSIFRNPVEADIVYGDLTFLRKDGPVVKRYPPPEAIKDWHFLYESLPHPATFISRRIFERIGGYDESFKIVSDAKFFMQAFFANATLAQLPIAVSRFNMEGISLDKRHAALQRTERRAFLAPVFGEKLAEIVTRPKPKKPKPQPAQKAPKEQEGLLKYALRATAAALAISLFFLHPAAFHAADSVPSSIVADSSKPLYMAPGDQLQLLYHFNLLGDYVGGALPWFRDLWQFNTADDNRPRNPNFCYAPAAIPFVAMRAMGVGEALAWNLDHLLFLLAGFFFCIALARRSGAGRGAALFAAALAACIPYRYATIATGSPTGFGMGLVPGVFLGADMAVRERSLRGGLLAGAIIFLLYAVDLHCFVFTACATPVWCAASAAFLPHCAQARPRRSLAAALAPIAAALAATGILGAAARRAYAGTNVETGRTLAEVAAHSPDWSAMFHVDPTAPLAGQLKTGMLLTAVFFVLAAWLAVSLAKSLRKRDRDGTRLAAGGLALSLAIILSYAFSVGTNGPAGGLLVRIARTVAPPFRLIRQPIKILCLLPAMFAAMAGVALSPRLLNAFHGPIRDKAAFCGNLKRLGPLTAAIAAAALAAAAFDARSGIVLGLCRLAGPNAAYEAAVDDAHSRGDTPRAIVIPISRGDALVCAAYQYWAQKSRLRMLDGYAAVHSHDYERNVYRRFRTMEEGDLTDGQLQGLRTLGVTSVIVHEDVLARVRPVFPGGATLRRMLSNPRLRLLACDKGVWAFALLPEEERAETVPYSPTVESAMRHKNFVGGKRGLKMGVESAAELRRQGYGWLVRAESGANLELKSTCHDSEGALKKASAVFPASAETGKDGCRLVFLPAPFPESDGKIRLEAHGAARVFDAIFAGESATGGVSRICFADLQHRWGETFLGEDGQPAGIRLVPGRAPKCQSVSGPFLPLAPDGRRVRLAAFSARRLRSDGTEAGMPEGLFVTRPDKSVAMLRVGDLLPGDGTEPVSFGIPFNPDEGCVLELRELVFADAEDAGQERIDL